MKKSDVIIQLLQNKNFIPIKNHVSTFAPVNIALIKYWGKRNDELNLPITPSLSISLGQEGSHTEISIIENKQDEVFLNDVLLPLHSPMYIRLKNYLHYFRGREKNHFLIKTTNSLPTSAGLASSASGCAALVKGLDQLFDWKLTQTELSILARMASGSACRSLWQGFVEWSCGEQESGFDSHGIPLEINWNNLCVGLCILSTKEKSISSREAMLHTVNTSAFYHEWPQKVHEDLIKIKQAIQNRNFPLFGETAESNALAMHATMHTSYPPIFYSLPETIACMQKIWQLRKEGLPIYFTQDAGPNLKLLFLKENENVIHSYFPDLKIIYPFSS